MAADRLAESLKGFATHPLVRAVRPDDGAGRARAAEEAAVVEATLARCRRVAGREPPQAFARTVELAVLEVRVVSGRYWSRDVAAWRETVLQELGALLFRHVGELEIEVHVGPDLRLARRDGFA